MPRARCSTNSRSIPPPTPRLSRAARRAASRLTRVLAADPDILLLDEPTNHLDLARHRMAGERCSPARRAAIAIVSHDRRLLADLTNATVWVDRGATHRLDRGFSAFEAWRDAKLEEEEQERHKLDRKIVNEEHWMRYGVTARRKRNMRRVGELAELAQHAARGAPDGRPREYGAQEAKASGALVIEAEEVSKAYDERPIVRDLSLRMMRGDRIGDHRRERGRQDDADQPPDRARSRRIRAMSVSARTC